MRIIIRDLYTIRCPILSIILASAGVLAGCREPDTISPQTQARLDKALAAYRAGRDAETLTHVNAVIVAEDRGYGAMQARYLRGLTRLRTGNPNEAAQDLRAVYNAVYFDRLRIKAADALAEALYRQGKLEESAELFKEVIRENPPDQQPCDHAYYRLGCIMQRRGEWREGTKYFNRLLYHFSGSPLATRGKKRALGRAWTIQVGAYREKRGAESGARQYREAGFDVNVQPELRSTNTLVYLVLVGRWDRHASASSYLPAVQRITADAFLKVTR